MNRPWFGPKRYGIGIGPTAPAGWVVMGVFVGAMSGAPPLVGALGWPEWTFAGIQVLAVAALLAVVVLKGDRRPLKWRWGERR